MDNLAQEGVSGGVQSRFSKECFVVNVGDVMLDLILNHRARAEKRSRILSDLGLDSCSYLLATVHRAESTDDLLVLGGILRALKDLSLKQTVIFPVHPRTRKAMTSLKHSGYGDVRFIEPIGYLDMIALMARARLVLTDSGGIQKEAFFLHVPCVTLRSETEWMETVECGWNIVAGTDGEDILRCTYLILEKDRKEGQGLFGAGDASEKIVSLLEQHLSDRG